MLYSQKRLSLALCLLAAAMFLGLPTLAAASPDRPIVFVHGYGGKGGNWDTMESRFNNEGWNHTYKFNYSSLTRSNKTSAGQLRDAVNWVRSQHGWNTVNLVAHSNGGLVVRWYRVFLGGSNANHRFVSLGSPHSGTSWAYGCFSPACFEMRYGSSFLNDLNGRGCDRSLWSSCDAIIIPNSSARCGNSSWMGCYDHVLMVNSAHVFRMTRDRLW